MSESSQFWAVLVDGSINQWINVVNPEPRQEENYTQTDFDVNILDEKMSLSQYYSQFADDMPDFMSASADFNDTITPIQPLLQTTIIDPSLFTQEEPVRKPAVRKPKIWKCTRNCGKIFTQERYMRNHILVMHEKTSLIQCKICSMYLSTKGRLKNHMIRHSGVNRFVCLICVNKKTNDKSCMRHHLSQKHGIHCKHSLFHQSYYELSLKEMSLVKSSKGPERTSTADYAKHTSVCKKSANDIEELRWKIMDKSKKVKRLLRLMNPSGRDDALDKVQADPNTCINQVYQIGIAEPQKIMTAENGMKLMKLPNGQFTKVVTA